MQTYDPRKGTLIWLIPGRAAGQCTVFWLAMNRKYNLFCLCPKQFGILEEGAGGGAKHCYHRIQKFSTVLNLNLSNDTTHCAVQKEQ